ncbi:AfsR/SARP family transcriptional regulator [Actinophytocola gossypii]|uniref:AfsR/SARP family transcriptional regulator n=1 Tax=Actinophytocola gossypii TaxID=2812003 RepID=A0ABT2J4L5_9PSEU|nr:AfsR/SARP family transcriptional regulator [Actinophytocola gossypii]MCT2582807.1 AfsR/SARP family transcriptional regulator [Actinophytocola gossypii]
MRLLLLGPLELLDVRGARVELAGRLQRTLLATLAVRAGQVVSAERLIAELWGGQPPANAANALQAHIARLRRVVEAACGEPDRIVTRPPGYLLGLRAGETDAGEFVERAGAARAIAAADPARAIPPLRGALGLWRGPALEGCATGDVCAGEAAVLGEHRLTTLETLYDACLRAGRHAEVVGELEETTAAHPLRERFYDQLMVALYRCGRQSDALGVYDRARGRLLHELGVEPGPALRARMRSILSEPPAPPAPPGSLDDTVVLGLDIGRELAELQRRVETLAERQEALLRSLGTERR